MPAPRYRLLSPLAALLVGAAIALLTRPGRPATPDSPVASAETPTSSASHSAPQVPATKTHRTRERPGTDSAAYAAAWHSLHSRPMPLAELRQLEQLLLAEWSVLDLQSALRAAAAEFIFGGDYERAIHPILHCVPGVAAHPELARQLIGSRALGPETAHLRSAWVQAFAASAPEQILADVPVMPHGFRSQAIGEVCRKLHAPEASPQKRREIMNQLFDHAGTPDGDKVLSEASAATGFSSKMEVLRENLLDASAPAAVAFYSRALAHRVFLISSGRRQELLDSLPEALRPAVDTELRKLDGG